MAQGSLWPAPTSCSSAHLQTDVFVLQTDVTAHLRGVPKLGCVCWHDAVLSPRCPVTAQGSDSSPRTFPIYGNLTAEGGTSDAFPRQLFAFLPSRMRHISLRSGHCPLTSPLLPLPLGSQQRAAQAAPPRGCGKRDCSSLSLPMFLAAALIFIPGKPVAVSQPGRQRFSGGYIPLP